ncbi:MAG: hypothetical protein AAF633_07905, partial [Chloroflexota bacterium]
ESLLNELQAGLNGLDLNENGAIDVLNGEGGLNSIGPLVLNWYSGSFFPDHVRLLGAGQVGTAQFYPVDGIPTAGLELSLYPVNDPAGSGLTYVLLLGNSDGTTVEERFLNLGPIGVEDFGIEARFEQDVPLYGRYDQILIALVPEAESSTILEPSIVIFEAFFDGNAQATLRNVLNGSGEEVASLLQRSVIEAALVLQHSGLMFDSLAAGDLAGGRLHAEHVINISVGDADSRSGDLDGDGIPQNPSADGTGSIVYTDQIATAIDEYAGTSAVTDRSEQVATITMPRTLDHILISQNEIIDLAIKVLSSDSAEEALQHAELALATNDLIFEGIDFDESGVIDPLRGESGMNQIGILIHKLTEIGVTQK